MRPQFSSLLNDDFFRFVQLICYSWPLPSLEFFLNLEFKVINTFLIAYQQEQFLGDNEFPEPDYY